LIVIRLISNLSSFKRHLCLTNVKNGNKYQNGLLPIFNDPAVKKTHVQPLNLNITGISPVFNWPMTLVCITVPF